VNATWDTIEDAASVQTDRRSIVPPVVALKSVATTNSSVSFTTNDDAYDLKQYDAIESRNNKEQSCLQVNAGNSDIIFIIIKRVFL